MRGLRIRNLSKYFGGLLASENINLDLPPGSRTALIGPNGAGKSTFANLLSGVLKPSSGEISFDGKDIMPLSEARRVKLGIAKTFQITTLFRGMSVRENIRLACLEKQDLGFQMFKAANKTETIEAEVESLLTQLDLSALADKLVSDLAYGQQRLVELALTLALRPKLLILDEPAAGVPSSETHLITDAIAQLPDDLSVLIIEHDMDLVFKVATSIIVLVQGSILTEGTPAEISKDATVRELYLGNKHA